KEKEKGQARGVAASPLPLTKGNSPAPLPSHTTALPLQASPVAARMAAEHGLELAQIKPEGGKVQKEDVLAYLAAHAATPAAVRPPTPAALRPLASPKARRLAQERGLDIAALDGSGPQGAVLAADVMAAETLQRETTQRGVSTDEMEAAGAET